MLGLGRSRDISLALCSASVAIALVAAMGDAAAQRAQRHPDITINVTSRLSGRVVAEGLRQTSLDCFQTAVEQNRIECRAEDFEFPQDWRPEGRMVRLINRRNESRYLRRADVRNSTRPGVPSPLLLDNAREAAAVRANDLAERERFAALTEVEMLEGRDDASALERRVTDARMRLALDAVRVEAQLEALQQREASYIRALAEQLRNRPGSITQRTEAIRTHLASAEIRVEATANQEILLTLPDAAAFPAGSAQVPQAANTPLAAIREMFTQADQANTYLVVIGHANEQGEPARNEELSLARATAVATALVGGELTSERVFAVGVGDTQNVAGDGGPEDRPSNRRIEIIVTPR